MVIEAKIEGALNRGDTNKKAIYSDALGHPQRMLKPLSQLVFLKVIYGINLAELEYDTGYATDLKAIATKIADQGAYTAH